MKKIILVCATGLLMLNSCGENEPESDAGNNKFTGSAQELFDKYLEGYSKKDMENPDMSGERVAIHGVIIGKGTFIDSDDEQYVNIDFIDHEPDKPFSHSAVTARFSEGTPGIGILKKGDKIKLEGTIGEYDQFNKNLELINCSLK